MKKITDVKELEKTIIEYQPYLLKYTQEQLQKEFKYFNNTYDFYILSEFIIPVRKDFSIIKDLYFDDEQKIPEVTEELFMTENIGRCRELEYKKDTRLFFKGCYTNKKFVAVCEHGTDYDFIRDLTEEEKEEYMAIIENIKKDYIDRLKKYYKRYSKHIRTIGYWTNR